jgi:hypothetical protein
MKSAWNELETKCIGQLMCRHCLLLPCCGSVQFSPCRPCHSSVDWWPSSHCDQPNSTPR